MHFLIDLNLETEFTTFFFILLVRSKSQGIHISMRKRGREERYFMDVLLSAMSKDGDTCLFAWLFRILILDIRSFHL